MQAVFCLAADFLDHPKLRNLLVNLGPEGIFSWIALLAFVARWRRNGDLSDMTATDIVLHSCWSGLPDAFIGELVRLRLLDDQDGLRIHDWRRWNWRLASGERNRKNVQVRYQKPTTENIEVFKKVVDESYKSRSEVVADADASRSYRSSDLRSSVDQSNTVEEKKYRSSREKKSRCLSDDLPAGFVEFYEAYPRKTGKQEAIKAFRRLNPSAELQTVVLDDVRRRYVATEWRYIPHPATYLNGRRWEDEMPPVQAAAGRSLTGVELAMQMLKEAEDRERNGSVEGSRHGSGSFSFLEADAANDESVRRNSKAAADRSRSASSNGHHPRRA